jgi:iron complex outermembrane receptor protein
VAFKRRVSSYTTIDWQTKAFSKKFTLTAGVKNLFDIDPPFTIRNAGGGNQSGYDGRYADPLGRQIYLVGNYKF